MQVKTILILNPYGIGNSIQLLPLLANLKSSFPGHRIEMIVFQKVIIDLLKEQNLISRFIYFDNSKKFNMFELISFIRKFKKNTYEYLLLLPEMSWKERLLAYYLKPKICIGRGERSKGLNFEVINQPNLPESIFWLEYLRVSGVPYKIVPPKYAPSQSLTSRSLEEKYSLNKKSQTLIGIHAGSSAGLIYKRWKAKNFAEIIDAINLNDEARLIVFGGPDDQAVSNEIANYANSKYLDLTNYINICDAAYLISNCKYFLSNDSGLMHLSAALGVKTFCLFGPTLLIKNLPIANAIPIYAIDENGLIDRNINNITVKDVLSKIQKLVQFKFG